MNKLKMTAAAKISRIKGDAEDVSTPPCLIQPKEFDSLFKKRLEKQEQQ